MRDKLKHIVKYALGNKLREAHNLARFNPDPNKAKELKKKWDDNHKKLIKLTHKIYK